MVQNGIVSKLADLAVRVGANVQPDQVVSGNSEPGKEYLTRAVAEAAYRAGARFVDVQWLDPWVKRARIANAREETLEYVPPWYGERMLSLGEHRAARIAFSGPTAPGLLDGLDPVRAGRDRLPAIKESVEVLADRTTNWTIVPGPNPAWARLVHPDLEPDAALERLCNQILHVCRLDEEDPVAVWANRARQLDDAAAKLTARTFDALHYEGPGTDLTVGLLPGHRWIAGGMETVDGVRHMANLPTEEVFTSPDPQRVSGTVAASRPLVLPVRAGARAPRAAPRVRDPRRRSEEGPAAEVEASSARDTMRTIVARDAAAARLGEVAL